MATFSLPSNIKLTGPSYPFGTGVGVFPHKALSGPGWETVSSYAWASINSIQPPIFRAYSIVPPPPLPGTSGGGGGGGTVGYPL